MTALHTKVPALVLSSLPQFRHLDKYLEKCLLCLFNLALSPQTSISISLWLFSKVPYCGDVFNLLEYCVLMSKLRNPSALDSQLGQGSVISDKQVLCWQSCRVAEDAATENFSQPPYCWFQVSVLPAQSCGQPALAYLLL